MSKCLKVVFPAIEVAASPLTIEIKYRDGREAEKIIEQFDINDYTSHVDSEHTIQGAYLVFPPTNKILKEYA